MKNEKLFHFTIFIERKLNFNYAPILNHSIQYFFIFFYRIFIVIVVSKEKKKKGNKLRERSTDKGYRLRKI